MYVSHERRAYILRLLEQHGHLRSADLAQELGVTDETIRTDLVALQRKGLLQRVHGGARYILPAAEPEDAGMRLDCRMADLLAGGLRRGMCLYLDASPFSLVLAWRLRELPCRLVSASPALLTKLSPRAMEHNIHCPGGEWDKGSGLLKPTAETVDYLRALPVDVAVLHPDSFSRGCIGYKNPVRAAWAAAAVEAATQCFAAAPSSCAAAAAPHTIPCTPDLLATEDNLPPDMEDLPNLHLLPYISQENLLPVDKFDY